MLAVDDKKFLLRFLQVPHRLAAFDGLEAQPLSGEQQNSPWYRWLADGSFVKVLNGSYFRAGEPALKSLFAALNTGDELCHIILRRQFLRLDLLAFIVKTADEADFS